MQNIYWGLSKTVARMADLQDKPTLLHEAATAAWVRRFQFQSLERAAAVAAVEDAPVPVALVGKMTGSRRWKWQLV